MIGLISPASTEDWPMMIAPTKESEVPMAVGIRVPASRSRSKATMTVKSSK